MITLESVYKINQKIGIISNSWVCCMNYGIRSKIKIVLWYIHCVLWYIALLCVHFIVFCGGYIKEAIVYNLFGHIAHAL